MANRYTVLIVDDAMTNIGIMSEMLKDDYDLVAATNGDDALKIMRGKKRPDIVLLDMIMPELDGYEVLKIMSEDEELRTLPVIVVTADSLPEARERAYSLGAVDFITRGDAQSVICHRIKSVLRLRETEKISMENELLKRAMTSERHLSALMDNLPGGVATIRTDGKKAECKYFNSKLPDLFRMDSDTFAMQFAMPVLPEWLKMLVVVAKSADSFTFEFAVNDAVDASVRQWIRVTAGGIGENDGVRELYCVFLDINAEKHNELRAEESGRQLRENQSRLETVVNNAPGGILYSERDDSGKFHINYINRGLMDILGYTDYDECLKAVKDNPKIGVSAIDEANILKEIADIPESGGDFKYSFKIQSVKGEELWLSMRCQMMRGEDGKVKMYAFISDFTKEKLYENDLRSAAFIDPLTGLFNRHAFIQNARRMLDENPLTEFSMMNLNIGSFKVVNDLLGRDVGDKVLQIIADAIRETFTGKGVFARFFSDNFIVLTSYSERGVHPQTFLDAVQKAVSESGLISHEIQYYIGVYKVVGREMSIENMADRAAIACRSINGSFQEHIAYYDEKMRLTMIEEQEICDESRRALENEEFCVYYQPVYGIKAKRFVSAEALVRWNHPAKGMISPGKFVPVFEKNGFIAELDLYVLEQVCKYMKRREEKGLPKFPISVNISRMSLYDTNLFETISKITDTYNIDPQYFRIEITESAYNDNPAQLLETIGKLREKCYPVLMDDFGSGYSSLNTLKDIPIDILKLDMKFMQGFEKNGKVGTIVTSVSRMAKWLNIPMLAEGVETKEQFDFLVSVGCAYIQGYYFSRPVPEEEFTRLIDLKEVTGSSPEIERYGLGEEVNELLGSNALVSKLISGAFGGFGIYEMYDNKLEVIRVNDGYREIMGYTPGSFEEERINIWDMMPPEDAEQSRKACLEAINTDKAVTMTIRRYDKSGKILYLEGIHRRLGGTEDNPIICIAFNDITEQIASEYQIGRYRSEMEEILGATGSVVTDIDYENESFFHAGDISDFGIDLDNIRGYMINGDEFENAFHPDDLKKVKNFYANKKPGKESEELRILNQKDGQYYWWRFTEVRSANDKGEITRTIGIANNIDSEKRAEIALEKERANVNDVMNQISVGILTVGVTEDHNAHIIFSNDSFWRIIGHNKPSDDEFFGKIYDGLLKGDVTDISSTVGNGGTVNSAYHITRSNGEKAVLEMSVGLSRVDEGNRIYMIIISDITEQYNNRQRLESIVRNFHDGLALVNRSGERVEIVFANDKFNTVLNIDPENTEKVVKLLKSAIDAGTQSNDVHIERGNTKHTVRLRIDEVGASVSGDMSYIVAATDVTLARAESKNRIAERRANADAGIYDEVLEINYTKRRIKPISSRRDSEGAEKSKGHSLDGIINLWGKKYVLPEDYNEFVGYVSAPADDPDFTDSYCELSVLDAFGDGEYHKLGLTMVRLQSDTCMLFIRDRARFDNSITNAQVEDTNRLYRLVVEQTNTAVIEINHKENKISASPLFKKFWSVDFSDDKGEQYEYVKQGPIVYHDDLKKYEEFMREIYKTHEPQTITLRLKMADGTFQWCRMSISINWGKDGRALTSLCTINFVHDEIVARMKAEQTDELLRRTVANMPVGVGVYKLENGKPVMLYVSSFMSTEDKETGEVNKFRFDINLFMEHSGLELVPGAEGSHIYQIPRPTGTSPVSWISVMYRVLEEGGDTIIYLALADVTDRVESQRREAASEQMYKMLLNDSGTTVFDYDPQTDTFTYLYYSGDNSVVHIENFSENLNRLTLIEETDREKFLKTLRQMPDSADPEEILVRICADGYSRRSRALFKSLADEYGNVFNVIGKIEDVEDELARIELMQEQAMYDSLCVDIFNKPTAEGLIRDELECRTAGALMMIDVDDFKCINDSFGHVFGDEFLKTFATTVKGTFREGDIVGRYGGDEFFVFMPTASAALAEKRAQQLLERISGIKVPIEGGVKSSIGIAAVTPENRDYRRILKQADSALYQAKNRGKNCAVLFEGSMDEEAYRTKEAVERGRTKVEFATPDSAASIVMRVFSSLYASADVFGGINQILELIGKTYDVSRVYIFEDSDDGKHCSNTFEWCGEGIKQEKETLQNVSYKDGLGLTYREQFGEDGIFYCHDINELNESARDIMTRLSVKSVLQCAIMDNGEYKGFVGFAECGSTRFWTQDQIDALAFISKVVSVFLMNERKRTKSEK